MMWMARERGANHLQFFSNSPMWWLTNSQSSNGAQNRGEAAAIARDRDLVAAVASNT